MVLELKNGLGSPKLGLISVQNPISPGLLVAEQSRAVHTVPRHQT